MKALIYKSVVRDVCQEPYPVAKGCKWVDCDDSVAVGYGYSKGQFTAPKISPVSAEQIEKMKRSDYEAEADPLYFKWKRGEATEQDWLNKISEIKTRYK